MQFKEFLTRCSTNTLENHPVICFSLASNEDIPIIFIGHFITYLKSHTHHIESVDLANQNVSQVMAQLQTSFLGMRLVYWLKGITTVDKKYRQTLLEYLITYTGPHQVIVIGHDEEIKNSFQENFVIRIPETMNAVLLSSLLDFLKIKSDNHLKKTIQMICTTYEKISLDQACMIARYVQVMGKNDNPISFFEHILESEKSLFTLSQLFFAKESGAFFKLWARFERDYPITFWTTFWSEQLWRAYHAHYFLARGQHQQAKSIGFRLPFTYLQRDWKKSNCIELKNAHQSIYELDLAFKNNIEIQAGIDLFYNKFFLNEFTSPAQ